MTSLSCDVQVLRPDVVDVSSGVADTTSKLRKDEARLRDFMQAVQQAPAP